MKIGVYIFIGWAVLATVFYPSMYSLISLLIISLYVSPFIMTFSYDKRSVFNKKYHTIGYKLLFLLLASGVSNLLIITHNSGHYLGDLLSIDGFKAIAISSSLIRYSEVGVNSGSPVLLAFNLFGLYRCGLSYANEFRYKLGLIFAPLVVYTLLTTEKYPLFLAVVFFLLGLLSNRNLDKTKKTSIFPLLVFLILLSATITMFAFKNRGYDTDFFELIDLIGNYVFRQFYNFGYWIVNSSYDDCCTYGNLTFVGPLNYLGVFDKVATVFSESISYKGYESNIYTGWRYLVQDFSVIGPFAINSFLALFFIIASKFNLFSIKEILRNFVIFSSMIGINVTVFIHNSVYLAFFICMFYRIYIINFNNDKLFRQLNEN